MRTLLPIIAAALAAPALAAASAAWADTCSGYDALFAQTVETTDLGHGMKLTTFKYHDIVLSSDSIINSLAGECSGSTLQTPDGKTQTRGFCARHDKDGDTHSVAFSVKPGANKGEWTLTGGTGKFAGKQGTGWFQFVLADGKMSATKWGGNCR
jgi:hypothetical protein